MKKYFKNLYKTLYNYIYSKYAAARDGRILKSLLENVPKEDIHIYKTLLINELNYLNNYNSWNNGNGADIKKRNLWLMVTKQVITNILVLREVVSIQPMTGPVGLIYMLQYTQPKLDLSDNELSTSASTSSIDDASVGRSLRLEIITQAIEAKSRKLCAGWDIECMQDQQALHHINIEAEIALALATEISHEIINEVISNLFKLGSLDTTVNEHVNAAPDNLLKLMCNINIKANQIACATRRGAGNKIITSPIGITVLQCLTPSHGIRFTPIPKLDFQYSGGLTKVGWLGVGDDPTAGQMYEVFMSMYTPVEHIDASTGDTQFLVLYKGSECDTGYVYSPYIPFMPCGVTIDPNTYNPIEKFITRYGTYPVTDDQVKVSQNYYRTVTMNALSMFPPTEEMPNGS